MGNIIYDTIDIIGSYNIDERKPNDEYTQKFNRRIKACSLMWQELQKRGILEKIAEKYEVFALNEEGKVLCDFLVDSDKLLPYRSEMEGMGTPDTDLACKYIFGDEGYQIIPCDYCGAIQTNWYMRSCREYLGLVGTSWEINAVRTLRNKYAFFIGHIKQKYGVLPAAIDVWRLCHENTKSQTL